MRDLIAKAKYDRKWRKKHPSYSITQSAKWYRKNKKRALVLHRRYHDMHPEFRMLDHAKTRAKKRGVPCTITMADIKIPQFCPVLGMELKRNRKHFAGNSPSLDCIIPRLGYVRGNVAVMSIRANRIKSDASLDEIKKVARWLAKQHLDFAKNK